MSLIPWRGKREENGSRTLAPLDTFRSEMDRLFESFFHEPFGLAETGFEGTGAWSPALDISENADEVTVRAEIPGVKPEELDVTVNGDVLMLSGEKKESTEKKDKDYWHAETRYGAFRRQVRLPTDVDAEKVDASYTNGVLTIRLKKSNVAKAKRITVKST